MKTVLLSLFSLALLCVSAQTQVYLNINHKLGSEEFAFNQASTNNLNNNFEIDRLEYYLSKFIVIHDNGMETPITDLHYLVNAGVATQIDLGTLNFTEIEGVKFSVGVQPELNHLDPGTYPSTHPLAPKNPSMHWGWGPGYRFVAIEGNAGSNLSTGFEIHALGDQLYFEASVSTTALEENGNSIINIDADYTLALKDIDITTGVISHGEVGESIDLLNNFKREVFKAAAGSPTGIRSAEKTQSIEAYPNPSKGFVQFTLTDEKEIKTIQVYDMLGSLVKQIPFNNANPSIYLNKNGLFFLQFLDEQNNQVGQTKIQLNK